MSSCDSPGRDVLMHRIRAQNLPATLSCVIGVAIGVAGCIDGYCTEIGCSSGLRIQMNNPAAAGAYRIEARVGGSFARFGIDCPGGPCLAYFPDFYPENVLIFLVTPSDTTYWEVRPTYTVSRPNGEDCPGECRNATVTITP